MEWDVVRGGMRRGEKGTKEKGRRGVTNGRGKVREQWQVKRVGELKRLPVASPIPNPSNVTVGAISNNNIDNDVAQTKEQSQFGIIVVEYEQKGAWILEYIQWRK